MQTKLLTIQDPNFDKYLNGFIEIYRTAFLNQDEAEDCSLWKDRLVCERNEHKTCLMLLISEEEVVGGLMFEYYSRSETFLLTYLAIKNGNLRKGLGSVILLSVLDYIGMNYAKARNVIFECENPWHVQNCKDPMVEVRLHFFKKHNATRINVDYVQPSLGAGKDRARNLWLMSFKSNGPNDLVLFLLDFYLTLESDFYRDIESVKEFNQMIRSINASEFLIQNFHG
jgi:hypothetical protein